MAVEIAVAASFHQRDLSFAVRTFKFCNAFCNLTMRIVSTSIRGGTEKSHHRMNNELNFFGGQSMFAMFLCILKINSVCMWFMIYYPFDCRWKICKCFWIKDTLKQSWCWFFLLQNFSTCRPSYSSRSHYVPFSRLCLISCSLFNPDSLHCCHI